MKADHQAMDPRTDQAREALAGPSLHEHWEDVLLLPPGQQRFFDRAFGELSTYLAAPPGSSILDVGCGPARHAIRLAQAGWRVRAVDFSPSVLAQARANASAAGLEHAIEFGSDDLMALSEPTGAWAYVLCWGVLMHVPDVVQAVAELSRVVGPRGWLVISELNGRAPEARALRSVSNHRGGQFTETAAGWERWQKTASGHLLVRHADIEWLSQEFGRHGLTRERRCAGQVSESYVFTRSVSSTATRAVDRLNLRFLWSQRAARFALGNILVFRRHPQTASEAAVVPVP